MGESIFYQINCTLLKAWTKLIDGEKTIPYTTIVKPITRVGTPNFVATPEALSTNTSAPFTKKKKPKTIKIHAKIILSFPFQQ